MNKAEEFHAMAGAYAGEIMSPGVKNEEHINKMRQDIRDFVDGMTEEELVEAEALAPQRWNNPEQFMPRGWGSTNAAMDRTLIDNDDKRRKATKGETYAQEELATDGGAAQKPYKGRSRSQVSGASKPKCQFCKQGNSWMQEEGTLMDKCAGCGKRGCIECVPMREDEHYWCDTCATKNNIAGSQEIRAMAPEEFATLTDTQLLNGLKWWENLANTETLKPDEKRVLQQNVEMAMAEMTRRKGKDQLAASKIKAAWNDERMDYDLDVEIDGVNYAGEMVLIYDATFNPGEKASWDSPGEPDFFEIDIKDYEFVDVGNDDMDKLDKASEDKVREYLDDNYEPLVEYIEEQLFQGREDSRAEAEIDRYESRYDAKQEKKMGRRVKAGDETTGMIMDAWADLELALEKVAEGRMKLEKLMYVPEVRSPGFNDALKIVEDLKKMEADLAHIDTRLDDLDVGLRAGQKLKAGYQVAVTTPEGRTLDFGTYDTIEEARTEAENAVMNSENVANIHDPSGDDIETVLASQKEKDFRILEAGLKKQGVILEEE